MSQKNIRIAALTLVVVAGIAGAAALAYSMQQQRVEQLTAQLETRDQAIERLAEKYNSLSEQIASQPVTTTPVITTDPPVTEIATEPSKPELTVSRQFAFVRKASRKDGTVSLVLDFAQFLTGSAAEKAAAAAGDEPPPNDYYISNTNPKLRTFSVAQEAEFVVAGGDPNDTDTVSAAKFYKALKANTDGAADSPYWFTITNGIITAGEEQWTP